MMSLIMLQSCDDYLDRSPWGGPSDENFFSNQEELMLVVNGLYSAMGYHPSDGMPTNLLLDNVTDLGWDRNVSAMQSVGRGDHDSNNGFVLGIWREAYRVIGKCNFVINNMSKLEGSMDANLYARLQAEARFVRAYTYQYLIDYFGEVPLLTENLGLDNAQVPKTPKAEVVDFVLQELEAIAPSLPPSYTGADIGRATRGAALTIRARAALNNGRWEEAASSAKAVMDLGVYSLHSNYGDLFTYAGENAQEIIFSTQYLRLQNVKTHNTPTCLLSRNAQGHTNKKPSQALIDLFLCTDGLEIDDSPSFDPAAPFENRDPRLGFTVALPGSVFFGYQFETHKDSTQCWNYNVTPAVRVTNQEAIHAYASFTGYCWRKYTDRGDVGFLANSELNVIQARYAEVLLIYAEAMIELNQIDETVYEAINEVRQRPSVDMPPISAGKTQQEMRQLVRKERVYELAMEGFRMVDLRRWELADKIMNSNVYGRIPKGLLASAPSIDEDGMVSYSNVPNVSEMRVVEVRHFNPERDYLWPIPNIETVTNPNLIQNPNY
ncbi:RagB/SusD family nutrient uptake outer membrane protein [Parapedobacter sp. DT-150]